MIAFNPRFLAVALAVFLVDAAPVPVNLTSSSSAALSSSTAGSNTTAAAAASKASATAPIGVKAVPIYVSRPSTATAAKAPAIAKVTQKARPAPAQSTSATPAPSQGGPQVDVNLPLVQIGIRRSFVVAADNAPVVDASLSDLDTNVDLSSVEVSADSVHVPSVEVSTDPNRESLLGMKVAFPRSQSSKGSRQPRTSAATSPAYKRVDGAAVPGTIQVVNGSLAAMASLVVDSTNSSAPVLAASAQNSTQIRLKFVSPDDFAAAGLNGTSLNATEVPVQMEIEAFNPLAAVTGAVGGVLQTLCATLGGPLDAVLGLLGLGLCPETASAASLFAYDTKTGGLRPFAGGQVVLGATGKETNVTSMSVVAADVGAPANDTTPANTTNSKPVPALSLVFVPADLDLTLGATGGPSAYTGKGKDGDDASPTSTSTESATPATASITSATVSATSTPAARRRFAREH